jgi:acyl-CoA synthetase (AMP-forming)/AMP-acid ligase II
MPAEEITGSFPTASAVLRAAAQRNASLEAYVEVASPGAEGVVPAGTDGRRRVTFAEWDRAADGVADALATQGVGRGDVVCLLLPSSIDYAVCYQAAMRLGAVTSGINLRLGRAEQDVILASLRPRVTVVDLDQLPRAAVPEGAGIVVSRTEIATIAREALRDAQGSAAPRDTPDPHDPVTVVWTSGSTGHPKGAVFDHANLAAVAAGTDVLSSPGDRRLSPLPFAHVGYMTRPWDEIAHGVTTVITPQPWSAAQTARLLVEERITVAQGVPTQWALLLAHPLLQDADLSALRIAGTGGSRVPPELVRAMRKRLGCPVVVRYTSTEASLGTGTVPGDPDEVVANTVGRPVPGVEMTLVDDAGQPVAPGTVGRVRLRSPAVMRGYVQRGSLGIDPETTGEVLDDAGWLTTGDLGRVGDDGRLTLVGRATEMLIRGGYNVYPTEVESVLGELPGLSEVAVVGVPDPVLGEIVVAVGVPAAGHEPPTLAALRALCAGRLADYKAPDRLYLVDSLPLTAMSKVDKRQVAAWAATQEVSGDNPARHKEGTR